MHWLRFALVVIGSGVVVSLTDWGFAGDWLHRRWTYPEAWRQGGEERAIALTSPLPFLTAAVFSYLAVRLHLQATPTLLKLAAAVWVLGPLPPHPYQRGVSEAASRLRRSGRDRLARRRGHRPAVAWFLF
jgi:hypothetical protein